MISVESISPAIVNTVCALRRGILRTPSLKITGRRQAIHPTVSRQTPSSATSTTMIVVSEMPNSSVIGYLHEAVSSQQSVVSRELRPLLTARCYQLRRSLLVVIDHDAVPHPHDPVALLADAAVVGDEHQRQSLVAIERFQQIDDFLGG